MVTFDIAREKTEKKNQSFGKGELLTSLQSEDEIAMNQGRLLNEAINRGLQALVPDLLFAQIVQNYALAEKIYGKKLLRLLTGFEPGYIERNIAIPEFKRELREAIGKKLEELRENGLLSDEGLMTEKGLEAAALLLVKEELDSLAAKGLLGNKSKKKSVYGEREGMVKKGRYKDLAVRETVKKAVRELSKEIKKSHLTFNKRISKSGVAIIYGLDASASMKGEKLEQCKKAGIALAYKALNEKDLVGLVVFGSEVKDWLPPTGEFNEVIRKISLIRASSETNMAAMIRKAKELLLPRKEAKHLVIISDALPTWGEEPEKETLEAAQEARNQGITLSVIGINLDAKGEALAKEIALIGNGRFMVAKKIEELDFIMLEEYEALKK